MHLQNSTSWRFLETYPLPNLQSRVFPAPEVRFPVSAHWQWCRRRWSEASVIYSAQSLTSPALSCKSPHLPLTATSWNWMPCWDGIRESADRRREYIGKPWQLWCWSGVLCCRVRILRAAWPGDKTSGSMEWIVMQQLHTAMTWIN